jgi:hypothetical protein
LNKDFKIIAKNILDKYEVFNIERKENKDRESFSHLGWMLEEIINSNLQNTKMARWFGYVLAILVVKAVDEEKKLFDFDDLNLKTKEDLINSHIIAGQYYIDNNLLVTEDFNINQKLTEYKCEERLIKILSNRYDSVHSNILFGYIQGHLVNLKLLNVEEERDRTRSIFNGE